jgi:hypothetical protein
MYYIYIYIYTVISEIGKEIRKRAIKSTDLPIINCVYVDDTSKGKVKVHPRPGHEGSGGE